MRLSGASKANIDAAERLDVDLSGASRLGYAGNPTMGNVSTSGGSSLQRK